MSPQNRILTLVLVCMLIMGACAPLAPTRESQASAPAATTAPSPVPPERNISLSKPVRVSGSWAVDPPERAVNGNPQDWWGAGGPSPQWLEVDLQGFYSVSKIRLVGPLGPGTYRVLGRGLEDTNQLLHVFDAPESDNPTLEFSPETAWQDLTTIRIEIVNGSGWVGLREVQVFSREEPTPLPTTPEAPAPSFLAQVQTDALEPITLDNAILMKQLAVLGRGTINQLAWSPDGRTLAAAGTLGVWLYDTDALDSPPLLLEGHTRDVLSVGFSLDGTIVYSGSQDGTVKEWDVATGNLNRTLSLWDDFGYEATDTKRDFEVWSIAFDADRTLIAGGSLDGTVHLWDLNTRRERTVLKGHTAGITGLAFSPDGSILASTGHDGSVFSWDVATGTARATLSGFRGWGSSLAFSPDGKTVAFGGADMTIHLWDAVKGEELATLEGHTGPLGNLAFSSNGLTLASNGLDGTLRLWDTETGSQLPFMGNAFAVTSMAFSLDGTTLASSTEYGVLQLWDTTTGEQRSTPLAHTSPVTCISFSPDGGTLASGGEDGLIRLWEVETNTLRGVLIGHLNEVTGVAFSPDGKLLASSSFDSTVRLWDAESGLPLSVLSGHSNFVRSVAFSPDSRTLASAGTDKTVQLWDVAAGESRATLTGHTSEVESVSFSPDGAWLASASADKTVRLWEVATGEEVGQFQSINVVRSVAFSPNGDLLAFGGHEMSLHVWNWEVVSGAAAGRDRFAPIGQTGVPLTVAFSPDGEIVASGGPSTQNYSTAPGEIHLYSAETGFPYNMLRGHTKRVTSIAFSPDGKLLATGSADGSMRLWGVVTN